MKLDDLGIKYSKFYEPDVGNAITAIATEGNAKLYQRLPLIGEKHFNKKMSVSM